MHDLLLPPQGPCTNTQEQYVRVPPVHHNQIFHLIMYMRIYIYIYIYIYNGCTKYLKMIMNVLYAMKILFKVSNVKDALVYAFQSILLLWPLHFGRVATDGRTTRAAAASLGRPLRLQKIYTAKDFRRF